VTGIVMFDSVDILQIPAGPAAVAGYADGAYANMAALAGRFPHACHLSIAVNPAHDADCLDIETGDARPGDAPGWVKRQQARGVARPCLYASVSVMQAQVIPLLKAAGIDRSAVRLWTAHYAGLHICAHDTCGEMGLQADGTQWTSRAFGRDLDQSILLDGFFSPVQPAPEPPEDEMPAGVIGTPAGVRESHAWPPGTVRQVTLYSDWQGVQDAPPVVALRIGHLDSPVYDAGHIAVNGTASYAIGTPADCEGCSFERVDDGRATVAWHAA
jgi:hypothetical protein